MHNCTEDVRIQRLAGTERLCALANISVLQEQIVRLRPKRNGSMNGKRIF